jgi:hypothetical protein
MNAGSTDTHFPHLDLGDLIAEVTGRPISDRAREHLSGCEYCQREAKRWNLVADGVRGLAAAAPEAAPPAGQQRTRRRVPAGPWRRAMLVAGCAAAALVLLVGLGEVTGYVHVHISGPGTSGSGTSGHGTGTALTAVTGCPRIAQVAGTLERVNGSSLVMKTASGQPLALATTASTAVVVSGAPLSDITDGKPVLVAGPSSGGTIAAGLVAVGGRTSLAPLPGIVNVRGTVSDASIAGFTVVTPAGRRVPVTTSGRTVVNLFSTSVGQLQAGARTLAFGYIQPHGTLSAITVFQPIRLFHPAGPPGAHVSERIRVHGSRRGKSCTPASIDRAVMALASGG